MKIEVLYDGSTVRCTINGEEFKDASKLDQVMALDAFRVIAKNYYDREKEDRV
jgi:hypothetical protein